MTLRLSISSDLHEKDSYSTMSNSKLVGPTLTTSWYASCALSKLWCSTSIVMLTYNSLAISNSSPSSNSQNWVTCAGGSAKTRTSSVASLCELGSCTGSGDRDKEWVFSCSRLGKGLSLCESGLS